MFKMMGVTGVVIMIMLFIVYRSVSTVLLVLAVVGFEMGTARGVIALLGHHHLLGFSTFVVAMLSSLAIAAGTDYAIFLIGRYQEARQAGEDRETAYYSMFRGTYHVILGSGRRSPAQRSVCTCLGCPTSRHWASPLRWGCWLSLPVR
ncbi:MMPL family protein [Mycobacterium ulcerans str. Harvey]|uniref:MMPL family protein n=1 Tax=Mycobacterium ulcerans str. Harvey TaxID=1299332 RepID=A0ABP3AG63_MYCUL|nr:MMPL family protein [Mycobacterium ulcerans str. Harvey]